jgi:hypothetical protein
VRRASIALVLLFAAACSNMQLFVGQECDTLYFGTQRQDGGVVSDAEWRQFLADVVTPRFPDGLTWWDGEGQWRDAKGSLEHERTHILQLVHTSDARLNGAVAEIIAEYKRRFAQESVLHVRSDVWLPSSR